MSMSDRKLEKEETDKKDDSSPVSCVVCFKQTEIFSIGECDHVVCYECSARLRVLLKQNDCMICRAELSQVGIVKYILYTSHYNRICEQREKRLLFHNVTLH